MWPSWVFGFSGFQSAPPIKTTLPKRESMGSKGESMGPVCPNLQMFALIVSRETICMFSEQTFLDFDISQPEAL